MTSKCYGSYGWREFNQNRQNILNEYDRLKELTERRPVKVAHGVAVEAAIRRWLAEYLPKKYSVTSGYVIPDVFDLNYKLLHYDVIIYNALESPVLWVENNLDDSESGKSRAIPAQYVAAIYEVKATLNRETARASVAKLAEIKSFSAHLPKAFSSGSFFVELKASDIKQRQILADLFEGKQIPGYWGGVILRCEVDTSMTGLLTFGIQEKGDDGYCPDVDLARPLDGLNIHLQEDGNLTLLELGTGAKLICTEPKTWRVIKEFGPHYRRGPDVLMLSWSHSKFSEFALQVVSRLEGKQHDMRNQPWYGQVFDCIDKKEALDQGESPSKGLPHLAISPCAFKESGHFIDAQVAGDAVELKVKYEVQNVGDVTAIVSGDGFNSSIEIPPGEKRYHAPSFRLSRAPANHDSIQEFIETLTEGDEHIKMTLRLVFRPKDDRNMFMKKVITTRFAKNKATTVDSSADGSERGV